MPMDHLAGRDGIARPRVIFIGYLTRLGRAEWYTGARRLLEVILDGLRCPAW